MSELLSPGMFGKVGEESPDLLGGDYEQKNGLWVKTQKKKKSPGWTVHEKPGVALMHPAVVPGTIQNKRWIFRSRQCKKLGQMEFSFIADELPYFLVKESHGITS